MERIVPEVLRLARERRRVTQRQMAVALGQPTDQAGVGHTEAAHGPPVTAQRIERWAKALGTTVAEMLAEYDALARGELPRIRPEDPPAEPFAPPGPERDAQLERLQKVCTSSAQIARVVGVSPQRIRQILQKGLAQ